MVLLVAMFVWPDGDRQDSLNLGRAEQFPVGEPRWFLDLLSPDDLWWRLPPVINAPGRSRDVPLAVIRHADDNVSAFLARDPRNGCVLGWLTDLGFGPGGFFRDPCHGSTYDPRCLRVFGPSPRGMDYLNVDINERGEVIVDLRALHQGTPVQQQPHGETPTPAGTPWPTSTPTPAP